MKYYEPFPHHLLGDFFGESCLRETLPFFLEEDGWRQYAHRKEQKPLPSSELLDYLTDGNFISMLSYFFNIPNLITDPTQFGAGLHRSSRNGKLGLHTDFNILRRPDPLPDLRRRINLILYCNPTWDPSWGGATTLQRKGYLPQKHIPITFNTALIFETTDSTLHGFPEPLQCPRGTYRQTIAMYYYTEGTDGLTPHSTLYEPDHSTIYKADHA